MHTLYLQIKVARDKQLTVPRGTPFPLCGEFVVFTFPHINRSNIQLIFTHIYIMDLLSNYPLCRSLDSPSDENTTL